MDGISVRQTGNRIRIGENAQALLGPTLFRDVGTRTDEENFIFPAAAVNEFISEEKQALPLAGLDPAFDFVGAAVTKKPVMLRFEAAASLRLMNSLNTFCPMTSCSFRPVYSSLKRLKR